MPLPILGRRGNEQLEQRLLGVAAVLGLVPDALAIAVKHVLRDLLARVHRPIGLDIGSRMPAEIAVATLAGLLADRNGRPGGFLAR